MKYKYRGLECNFQQFLSAYLATALGNESAILDMVTILASRHKRGMVPRIHHASQIEHDTLGQCLIVWDEPPPAADGKDTIRTPVVLEKVRGEGENAVYHMVGNDSELIAEITSITPKEALFLMDRINRE